MRAALAAAVWAVLALAPRAAAAQRARDQDAYRFVVLGHIRGGADGALNPKLGELFGEVRGLRPDFVVLTGDIIWGDVDRNPTRPAELEREWTAADSALATLGVPVHRVPGNHDVLDVTSRDIWRRRYGMLPAAFSFRGGRFLLLSSAFIPPDGDTTHHRYVNGVDLDSAQLAFLARELGDSSRAHTFAFLHHKLWWQPDSGRWWRDVHPMLRAGRVDAVFSGDYGPLKFSTLERDGVRYYQTSIELPVALPLLQNRISSRVLSSQFDNFLEVRVDGPRVDVVVHTIGEVSSGEFTPGRYRDVTTGGRRPGAGDRLRAWIGSPKRIAAMLVGLLGVFAAGWWVGRRRA